MYVNLSVSIFLAQDAKFGFGGVKRGVKRNSSQSFSDVSSFNSAKHSKAPRAKSGNVVSLHWVCVTLVNSILYETTYCLDVSIVEGA